MTAEAETDRAYPRVGEVFELALDGAAPENQPLEMVESFGYNPAGWSHNGPTVSGQKTRRFKLVQVGYCSNMEKVKVKVGTEGAFPEGQWINAFKAAFPEPDGQGPVGIPDASWIDSGGRANYPYILAFGLMQFNYAGHIRIEDWRWLVAVE
ncbi:MAG: hypothetical protein WAL52_24030 [Candidatus Sulfotelmatobacter sp.]